MSSSLGNKLKVQLFGQSHSPGLGVVIDGLPAGKKIDLERIEEFLQRRAGGKHAYSTKRGEPDTPTILSGLVDGKTCGAPLCAIFDNTNTRSSDYEELRRIPRPSHADFTAFIKHSGHNDVSGGGHFSARLTLPLCFAGAVCIQLLEQEGIAIDAHIHSLGGVKDDAMDAPSLDGATIVEPSLEGTPRNESALTDKSNANGFPTKNRAAGQEMIRKILAAAAEGDSLGGVVECGVWGVPAGLGEPIFDNLESRLAYGLFAIPAVKGVEFGAGFKVVSMRGSQFNDPFYMDNDKVKTRTNHSGGILGGITNGMPVMFKVAFKPTPSIAKPQQSVNLQTGEDVTLKIKGRHDPCVVPRGVPCVMATAAIIMLDIILGG